MKDNDVKRISRLTAIVTQLQTRRLLTVAKLAEQFGVSIRTIYRDIKALEQAGIPVLVEEGKGYTLMEGYRMPPVMFTETEAGALVTAEQIILRSGDTSLINAYRAAIDKVKAVLHLTAKDKMELLSNRIAVSPMVSRTQDSNSLTLIQQSLTHFKVLQIAYQAQPDMQPTTRNVEPYALYNSFEDKWLMIAYCRLRRDFRMFRLDRVLNIKPLNDTFEPGQFILTQFLEEKYRKFNTPDNPLS